MLRRSINLSQFNSSNQIKADQMESSQNFFSPKLSTKLNALIIIYPVHVFLRNLKSFLSKFYDESLTKSIFNSKNMEAAKFSEKITEPKKLN